MAKWETIIESLVALCWCPNELCCLGHLLKSSLRDSSLTHADKTIVTRAVWHQPKSPGFTALRSWGHECCVAVAQHALGQVQTFSLLFLSVSAWKHENKETCHNRSLPYGAHIVFDPDQLHAIMVLFNIFNILSRILWESQNTAQTFSFSVDLLKKLVSVFTLKCSIRTYATLLGWTLKGRWWY